MHLSRHYRIQHLYNAQKKWTREIVPSSPFEEGVSSLCQTDYEVSIFLVLYHSFQKTFPFEHYRDEVNLRKKKEKKYYPFFCLLLPFFSFKVMTVQMKKDLKSSKTRTSSIKVQRVYIVSDLGLHLIHSFLLENYLEFSSAYHISQETLVLKGLKLQGNEIKLSK